MGNQLSNPNISSSVSIPSAFISRGKKKGCVASREVVRRTRRLPERYHESSNLCLRHTWTYSVKYCLNLRTFVRCEGEDGESSSSNFSVMIIKGEWCN